MKGLGIICVLFFGFFATEISAAAVPAVPPVLPGVQLTPCTFDNVTGELTEKFAPGLGRCDGVVNIDEDDENLQAFYNNKPDLLTCGCGDPERVQCKAEVDGSAKGSSGFKFRCLVPTHPVEEYEQGIKMFIDPIYYPEDDKPDVLTESDAVETETEE